MLDKVPMTPDEYVSKAGRTDAPLTAELVHRLTYPIVIDLLHATLGMVTEAGEMADMLKKHVFAGKELDLTNAQEELGDELWYIALAIRTIRSTMADVMEMNIEKLRLRYPDRFEEDRSHNRDVDKERDLLENMNSKRIRSNSKRGTNWVKFANIVLDHIENYTVPQYGDEGEDKVTHYSFETIKEQLEKYFARMDSGVRGEKETLRDLLKIAHYASFAYEKSPVAAAK